MFSNLHNQKHRKHHYYNFYYQFFFPKAFKTVANHHFEFTDDPIITSRLVIQRSVVFSPVWMCSIEWWKRGLRSNCDNC